MKSLLVLLLLLISSLAHAQLTNESEAGIAAANGNTKTQTYTFKQLNDYKWEMNVLSFKSRYLNAEANGVETARYFMGGLRYEKQLSNHFGIFVGETFEKDKFAGIDERLMTDVGGKYRLIESDATKLFAELGYRYMHEERLDDSKAFSNYGRVYSEWEQKWNTNFTTKYWAEYLPNISDNKDWQFNTELSLSAVLSDIFSLKSGVLLRYDHFPAPGILYKTDTLFTTALVAKF
jgi:putative salt-induced outer membrane protein